VIIVASQEFDLTAANYRFEKLDNPDTGTEGEGDEGEK
jgi:hypothetical protein